MEQAGEGEAARAALGLGQQAEGAGDPPGPEDGVVGGELVLAQALGFVEHRQPAVQRPGPGLEVDGDAGDADARVEGRDPLVPLPSPRRGDQSERDKPGPEGARAPPAELWLEDEADAGAGLEGVVGEEPEGREGGEGAAHRDD